MQKKIPLIFFLVLLFFLTICTSQRQNLSITLKINKSTYKYGEPIKITYEIQNHSMTQALFFDRAMIKARFLDGEELYGVNKDTLWRSDWRESKNDYIKIDPGEKITRTYLYSFSAKKGSLKRLPYSIKIYYEMVRKQEDNYYYDFKNQGIEAHTKIPIKAWTGNLKSNEADAVMSWY